MNQITEASSRLTADEAREQTAKLIAARPERCNEKHDGLYEARRYRDGCSNDEGRC